jgi:hypothetical protein
VGEWYASRRRPTGSYFPETGLDRRSRWYQVNLHSLHEEVVVAYQQRRLAAIRAPVEASQVLTQRYLDLSTSGRFAALHRQLQSHF